MAKKINFVHYRKFKNNNSFNFNKSINVITGTNGTCKTSLLHLISNSYKSVTLSDPRIENGYIKLINQVADGLNLKVEALTKGDKEYTNPSHGTKGTLFSVEYYDENYSLDFRRHNSSTSSVAETDNSPGLEENKQHRFALKPQYSSKGSESLPARPVIYLGLSRLYPYGEYNAEITIPKQPIPGKLLDVWSIVCKELEDRYEECLGLQIISDTTKIETEILSGIRNKSSFNTSTIGVDSNTISSGQDNLYVILKALACLRFYYEGIIDKDAIRDVESILLIDEFDATLHPEIQIKLFEYIYDYSSKYKIQVAFTTHSFTLIEHILKNKAHNLLYIIDDIDSVRVLEDISFHKINMFLQNKQAKDIFSNKKIPVYTEDAEARLFIQAIFDYYTKQRNNIDINNAISTLHLVQVNLGSDNIKNLFLENFETSISKSAIAILDGDQYLSKPSNNMLSLPRAFTANHSHNTPEYILAAFAIAIFNGHTDHPKFWQSQILNDEGFTLTNFRSEILKDMNSIINLDKTILEIKEHNEYKSTKGLKRSIAKELFNTHIHFLKYVLHYWVRQEDNQPEIYRFLKHLNYAFKNVAPLYNIPHSLWNIEDKSNKEDLFSV